MWYVVTLSNPPRFITFDSRDPIELKGVKIGCPGSKRIGEKIYARGDSILNGAQAISILYNAGVPGFPTKKVAKEAAMGKKLTTWKYLKVSDEAHE